jgi:hypothetical protein
MHRSLSIELDLSSPTKRFSLAGLEFHSGNRPRSRRRSPDFAPSSETPGGYVGQDFGELSRAAVLERGVWVQRLEGSRFNGWQFCR